MLDENVQKINTFEKESTIFDDKGQLKGLQKYMPGEMEIKNIQEFINSTSIESLPKKFVPDFARSKPTETYEINHTIISKVTGEKTKVEVYEGILSGRKVEWHMAYTDTGMVWIDRISFREGKKTSYGTDAEIINSGALTNKPFEYVIQLYPPIRENLERVNITGLNHYMNITQLLSKMGPIKAFMEAKGIVIKQQKAS